LALLLALNTCQRHSKLNTVDILLSDKYLYRKTLRFILRVSFRVFAFSSITIIIISVGVVVLFVLFVVVVVVVVVIIVIIVVIVIVVVVVVLRLLAFCISCCCVLFYE
jgi:hypothetical protein